MRTAKIYKLICPAQEGIGLDGIGLDGIGLPDVNGTPIREGDVLLSTESRLTGKPKSHAALPKNKEWAVEKKECYYVVRSGGKRSKRFILTGLLVFQNGLIVKK